MISTKSTNTKVQIRDTRCPICQGFFTEKGVTRHILRMHSSAGAPPEINNVGLAGADNLSFAASMTKALAEARSKIAVVRVIPSQSRLVVSKAYEEVLEQVVEKNDQQSWEKLLSFAYIVLRLPAKRTRKSRNLNKVIAENLKEFRA